MTGVAAGYFLFFGVTGLQPSDDHMLCQLDSGHFGIALNERKAAVRQRASDSRLYSTASRLVLQKPTHCGAQCDVIDLAEVAQPRLPISTYEHKTSGL